MLNGSDNLITLLHAIVDLLKKILNKLESLEQSITKIIRLLLRALDDELEEWLPKQETMNYLKIKKSTYYRWVADGTLEPRGTAGEDKFYKRDLKKILEERRYRKRKKPTRKPVAKPKRPRKQT